MLRISVQEDLDKVGIDLEGRLAGIWVTELEDTWRSIYPELDGRPSYIYLTGVDHVDRAGTYLLGLLYHSGAQLIASGAAMTELVRSIEEEWPRTKTL